MEATSYQVQVRATNPVGTTDWSPAGTGTTMAPRLLTWTGGFVETAANDGTVTGTVTATLSNDTFVSDVLTAGYLTARGVPGA